MKRKLLYVVSALLMIFAFGGIVEAIYGIYYDDSGRQALGLIHAVMNTVFSMIACSIATDA
jgi:hypothetical protein